MTSDQAQAIAPHLSCPWHKCNGATLTFAGMYGPRSGCFARFVCPKCEASYPDGSPSILRQLPGAS